MTAALRLATRGSELALVQTDMAMRALASAHSGIPLETRTVVSEGDRILDRPLWQVGGKDLFIKELEAAILAGDADVAVHSLKDVGARLDARFSIAATLERADPRDALVCPSGATLQDLPAGAVVGTSSPRRIALVRAMRPDLRTVSVRGNVRTRLARLGHGIDALLLAAAGLDRLGLSALITQRLDADTFVPSPGQGTVAIECRADNSEAAALAAAVSHPATMAASLCERAVARRLGASCRTPLGAYARTSENNALSLRAFLANPATGDIINASGGGDFASAENIGERAALELLNQGGQAIIDGQNGDAQAGEAPDAT